MATPTRMEVSDFQYQKQLGTGAFSKVLMGLHKPTGIRYAVKLISKRTIMNAPTDEERIRMAEVARRESRMLLICEHPNIVKFYRSMQTPEELVYVTELCAGGELLAAIRARRRIPLEASRHAIAELLSAVFYLHTGTKRSLDPGSGPKPITIIHRDIKPENVMLSDDYHIKLIDFGTAVICESVKDRPEDEDKGKGRAQTFCGTTYYMSPELLQDSYTCCESDFWGCGCVLFHMLVGKRPFDAPTQYLLIKVILEQEPSYPDDLDPHAKDLIQRLLAKSPDDRPTMEEIKNHPFFATLDFSTLSKVDVSHLWTMETPWVDEADAENCESCHTAFGWASGKDFCRRCGHYFCAKCLTEKCCLPNYRYSGQQRVCEGCSNALKEEE